MEEEVIFVQSYKLRAFDLDLEHTLHARSPGYPRVQVWSQSTICLREQAIFVPAQKCPYHITFDLALALVLDARLPGDHASWSQSSHLYRSRSDLCKKFTDRRRTPRDCISSWNELKNNISFTVVSML